jgi:hypothetical protein
MLKVTYFFDHTGSADRTMVLILEDDVVMKRCSAATAVLMQLIM